MLKSAVKKCIDSSDSYIEHHSHANTKVRSSNLTVQKQEWEDYRNRWEEFLGVPARDWIESDYVDGTNTAGKFSERWFGL